MSAPKKLRLRLHHGCLGIEMECCIAVCRVLICITSFFVRRGAQLAAWRKEITERLEGLK